MKKLLFFSLLVSCCGTKSTMNCKYRSEVDSLNYEIKSLIKELRYKEREISYWGHKYDSAIVELNKYK